MADAYCSAIDTIQADEVASSIGRNEKLHFMLWTFNSLGQTVPILETVLDWLSDDMSVGKARWWLVLCAGLCYSVNGVPWIAPWSTDCGGGGVYLLEASTPIFDAGFLAENVNACRELLTLRSLTPALQMAEAWLPAEEADLAAACLSRLI